MYVGATVLFSGMLFVLSVLVRSEDTYRALDARGKCAEACRKHHGSVRKRVVILRKRVLGQRCRVAFGTF